MQQHFFFSYSRFRRPKKVNLPYLERSKILFKVDMLLHRQINPLERNATYHFNSIVFKISVLLQLPMPASTDLCRAALLPYYTASVIMWYTLYQKAGENKIKATTATTTFQAYSLSFSNEPNVISFHFLWWK